MFANIINVFKLMFKQVFFVIISIVALQACNSVDESMLSFSPDEMQAGQSTQSFVQEFADLRMYKLAGENTSEGKHKFYRLELRFKQGKELSDTLVKSGILPMVGMTFYEQLSDSSRKAFKHIDVRVQKESGDIEHKLTMEEALEINASFQNCQKFMGYLVENSSAIASCFSTDSGINATEILDAFHGQDSKTGSIKQWLYRKYKRKEQELMFSMTLECSKLPNETELFLLFDIPSGKIKNFVFNVYEE